MNHGIPGAMFTRAVSPRRNTEAVPAWAPPDGNDPFEEAFQLVDQEDVVTELEVQELELHSLLRRSADILPVGEQAVVLSELEAKKEAERARRRKARWLRERRPRIKKALARSVIFASQAFDPRTLHRRLERQRYRRLAKERQRKARKLRKEFFANRCHVCRGTLRADRTCNLCGRPA